MKAKVHMNVYILCAQCSYVMTPVVKFLPRRVCRCENVRCKMFDVCVEIEPFEVDVVPVEEVKKVMES